MFYFENFATVEDQNKNDLTNNASDKGTTLPNGTEINDDPKVINGPENGMMNDKIQLGDNSSNVLNNVHKYVLAQNNSQMSSTDILNNVHGHVSTKKDELFTKCPSTAAHVQMSKVEASMKKIQKIMNDSKQSPMDLYANNDDVFVEIVSMLASINGMLDNEEFMKCVGNSLREENPNTCSQVTHMLDENNKNQMKNVVNRFSFVLPTVIMFTLKIIRAVNRSCPGIDKSKVDKLYQEMVQNITKLGQFMDLDNLDSQYQRVDRATTNLLMPAKDTKESFNTGCGCRSNCKCGGSLRKLIFMVLAVLVLVIAGYAIVKAVI